MKGVGHTVHWVGAVSSEVRLMLPFDGDEEKNDWIDEDAGMPSLI